MPPMNETFSRLLRETEGQDLAEYGIALAVVAVACASAALMMARDVNVLWTRALQTIIISILG